MRFWHKADMPDVSLDVRFRGQSGHLNAQIEFFRFWTQSGHWLKLHQLFQSLAKYLFQGMQCCPLSLGTDVPRREFTMLVGGSRAACGARAAADG